MRSPIPPRSAVLLALLVMLGGRGIQSASAAEPLEVSLEAATFPAAGGGAETHVYLMVPLRTVAGESAAFHVRLKIEPEPESGEAGGTWVYPPVPVRGGGPDQGMFRRVFVYRLSPGRGKAHAWVEELGSERAGEAVTGFDVPRYGKPGLTLSDVVVGTAFGGEGDPDPVLPLPQREFGRERETVVVFLKVRDDRGGNPAPTYRATAVFQGRRGFRREQSTAVPRREEGGEVLLEQNVSEFPPGDYRVQVEIALEDLAATAEGWFRVGESGRTLGSDPDRLRTVLGYIATHRERILLEEAPDDSLSALWDRFWVIRDPSPGTARNESEEEFLSRVQEADRRFGSLDPGWRTDMGRIFIRYGPPDRVEKFEGEPNRAPSEVWTYSARGERFIFQDEGLGRFRLALGR